MKVARSVLLVGVALLADAAGARAGIVIYNNRADYNAATTGNTVIDFEGIAGDNDFVSLPTPPGITLSGVNFTIDHSNGNKGNLFVLGKGFYYPGNSVLSSQGSTAVDNNLLITLPGGGSTGVGLDFGSFSGSTFTFTLSTGDTFTETPPTLPGLDFVGVTSTAPIVSVRISTATDEVLNIDNFTFGTAVSAVPEPATAIPAVLAAAIGLIAARRRRRAGS